MEWSEGKDVKSILGPDVGKFIYKVEERTTEALIVEMNSN